MGGVCSFNPSTANMDNLALREHVGDILLAIASDMRFSESADVGGEVASEEALYTAFEEHPIERLGSGFHLTEVFCE